MITCESSSPRWVLPHDPETGEVLSRSTAHDIITELVALPERTKLMLLTPVERLEGESIAELADRLKKQGFLRLRVDGEIVDLESEAEKLDEGAMETEIVVDRLVIKEDIRSRLADSVETCLRWSGSRVVALIQEGEEWIPREFTTTFTNPKNGLHPTGN